MLLEFFSLIDTIYIYTIIKNKTMRYKYQIGQKVTFTRSIFGKKSISTNIIKYIEEINGENVYFIGGVGQALFEKELNGKEDCFEIRENKIIK